MQDRVTLKNMSEKFIKKEITDEEFRIFFEEFKSKLGDIREEFKKTVEPSIYYNADSKKISEKSALFTSLFDEMERGIRVIENSLSPQINMEKFEKGYKTILTTSDKLEKFHSEVSTLANSTPM